MTLVRKATKAEARQRFDDGAPLCAASTRGYFDGEPRERFTFTRDDVPWDDFDAMARESCRGGVKAWGVPIPDPRDVALDAIFHEWATAQDDTVALRRIADILATTGRSDG